MRRAPMTERVPRRPTYHIAGCRRCDDRGAGQTHRSMSPESLPSIPVTEAAAAAVNLSDAVVLKEGPAFAVTLRDGTVPVGVAPPLGLFRDDCRPLSGHELRVGGALPRLLVASAATGDEGIT